METAENEAQTAAVEVKEKKEERDGKELHYLQRFSLNQRLQHIIVLLSFTALTVTGITQKFYTAGWAEWLILNMGGIEATRLLHRAFALIFVLAAGYHLLYLGHIIFVRHSRLSMLPNLKDVRDIVVTMRYSFGFTEERPQFGRFDYRQKFEYWGMMFGSIIMIVSGFVLTFPVTFTAIIPGQFVAAAKVFHGNEAMLAALTIVIWHLYDVIFKPGVFPADLSIFTGRISRERMQEEHLLEYNERLAAPPAAAAVQPAEAGTAPQASSPL